MGLHAEELDEPLQKTIKVLIDVFHCNLHNLGRRGTENQRLILKNTQINVMLFHIPPIQ